LWTKLSNFPQYIESLEECTNLRELDLSENSIEKIKGLDALTALEHLNLSANSITKWEGLATLKALQHLDLSSNGLIRLSSSIANHAALTVLKLDGNQLNVVSQIKYFILATVINQQCTSYEMSCS
jgi:Leucine-rich repeat (LRR) protein